MKHLQFNDFLNNHLNTQQYNAVTKNNGSILVIAGAGSGKTRVITARITHLILNEGVNPSAIIALTFTNKAAREMKERINNFLNNMSSLPFIGTFHAYCLRLLKQNHISDNISSFSILDEEDQQKLISTIIKRKNIHKQVSVKQLAYHISLIKNQTLAPHESELYQQNHLLQEIYTAYEHEKKMSNCLDFDDLLLEVVKLLRTNDIFKQSLHNKIRHILVDEYQDTNIVQHELLKHLALHNKKLIVDSICVVGDEDQSIYSWRGATVTNIRNFKKDFSKTTTIKIEQNYRSVQPILEIANHIISHNKNRIPKMLWSERSGSNRICVIRSLSEYQEADAIARFLKNIPPTSHKNSSAILYRAHFQSRALEEALLKHSIPYTIIGGIQFYERKEIKDLLAYLRLIINPYDRASFLRIINCPTRGLGEQFEELFHLRWNHEPLLTFSQVADLLINNGTLNQTKKRSLQNFITMFKNIDHTTQPSSALEHIITATNYINHLKKNYDEQEAQIRIENVKELINALTYFETHGTDTIAAFLDEVALMQEKITAKDTQQNVVLMTLHAAKGLEFDTVIIAGLNEGTLPSIRASMQDEDLEEERRLFYVGITRARERLLITYTRHRYLYGQMNDQISSRFLKEIPTTLLQQEDSTYWNIEQLDTFFSTWTGFKQKYSVSKVTHIQKKQDNKTAATWKKNQPVKHQKFGIGIIQKIEHKGNATYHITARFKSGIKKIDAKFLTCI